MKVLGIDPGSRITGYGVVERNGNRLIHIDNGCIVTSSESMPGRLTEIYERLQKIIEEFDPSHVAIEDMFFAKNVKSALKLGQARGAAILSASNSRRAIFEYTPLQVKMAVVGYGRGTKDQVQRMTKLLLNLPEIAQSDAADALAVAICHINTCRY